MNDIGVVELVQQLVLNPENLDKYNTKDFYGNPQIIFESDNSIYFLTNNTNNGKFYFSRNRIGSVLIIDRITKMIFYKDVSYKTKDDDTKYCHTIFKKICKLIVSNLKKHNYYLIDFIGE